MAEANKSQLNCDTNTGICEIPQSTYTEQNKINKKPIKLLYFTDPICSSCWGIEPQLRKLKYEYGQYFDIEYRMGGLLKSWSEYGGNDVNGPSSVAKHWDEASLYYNMPIDGDIWNEDPLESSYPPSVGFKAATLQGNQKAELFLRRIKEMVFTEKKNIEKFKWLLQAAKESELDVIQFEQDFQNKAKQLFEEDLSLARQLGVRGFPTIYFMDEEQNQFKVYGSKPYQVYETALLNLIPRVVIKDTPIIPSTIFETYKTVTLNEFAQFYNLNLNEAEITLSNLTKQNKVKRVDTKRGSIWIEITLLNQSL